MTAVVVTANSFGEPISHAFLVKLVRADLRVNDRGYEVEFFRHGRKVATVFESSAEDSWVCFMESEGRLVRVQSRDDGIRRVLGMPAVNA